MKFERAGMTGSTKGDLNHAVSCRRPQTTASSQTFRFPIKNRLQIGAIGVFCTLAGVYQYTYGGLIGQNWLHQPVYSTSLIAMGVPVILSALIPSSWIENAAKWIAS
jgi:hypothetical protein